MAGDAAAVGVALLSAGRWCEAHEAWECAWRGRAGPEREVWQGSTRAARERCLREGAAVPRAELVRAPGAPPITAEAKQP